LITSENNKEKRIYIVGKAEDLANRLSGYNKTCLNKKH
jgi:excinuclease UvrABC nuclease subunit